MRLALLTSSNLDGYVTDDEAFFKVLKSYEDMQVSWCVWDQPQDWSVYDYAIIRTTWDYTKKLSQFLETLQQIEASGCRLLNNSKIVQWNSNKKYLIELAEKGLNTVPTELFDKQRLSLLFDLWQTEKLVLKPLVGATAEGIRIIGSAEVAGIEQYNNYFVQPFVDKITDGEKSFHFFNNQFSHGILKVPKSGDFRVQEEHGGDIRFYQPPSEEIDYASQFLLQDYPYARVDLVNYRDQLVLMELELIEPSLYFRMDPESPLRFAKALREYMGLPNSGQ